MLGLCVVMTDAVMLRVLIQCLADVLTVWYTSWNIKKNSMTSEACSALHR